MHSLLICLGTQFKTPSLIFKVLYSLKLWTQKIVFTHMNLPDIRYRHPASVNRNKFDGHTEQGFLSHGPLTLEFVTLSDLSCFFTSEDLLKTLLFWTALDISFSLSLCCLILCLILLLNLEFMAQLDGFKVWHANFPVVLLWFYLFLYCCKLFSKTYWFIFSIFIIHI